MRTRRSAKTRLLLTLAALTSAVVGYYLGQYWQRQPLSELSAIVYPDGKSVDYPAELGIAADPQETGQWRLIVTANTQDPACRELLRHFALVRNRLAGWPMIQQRLRLGVLAYDAPQPDAARNFSGGADWIDIVSANPNRLEPLAASLGILPDGTGWCSPTQANAILVGPDRRRWALIPYEQAAIMAHNIATIIQFVE